MKVLISLLMTVFSFAAVASPELKGYPEELRQFLHPQKPTVSITAKATEKAYTDKAIVSLIVSTEEDKLASAMQKNSEIRMVISKALIEFGLKPSDVNTSKFSSSPQYGWFGDEPDSFEVVNRMAINVYDSKQFRLAAELADKYKEVHFAETEFEHTEKELFQEKVKKQVLSKVMAEKISYEQALGLKLKAISFHSPYSSYGGSRGARSLEEKIIITGSRIKRGAKNLPDEFDSYASAPKASQSFDEIEYQAEITVTFEVIN